MQHSDVFPVPGEVTRWVDPHTGHEIPCRPICQLRARQRTTIAGWICATRSLRWNSMPVFEVEITDGSGAISLCFMGRHEIAGLVVDAQVSATGMTCDRNRRLVLLNPRYRFTCSRPHFNGPLAPGSDSEESVM